MIFVGALGMWTLAHTLTYSKRLTVNLNGTLTIPLMMC